MQPTKNNGGAISAPPNKLDDRIILAGLFGVCLTAWGPNLFYSQAFMLVIIAFCALAIMIQDRLVSLFAIYLSCWFAYLYSASTVSLFPGPGEVIIQVVDTLQLVTGGFLIYFAVRYGRTSKNSYMNVICILAAVLSIIGLIRFFHFFHGDGRAIATLGNENFLAAFLAISAPFFFRKRWWMLLPLIIGALIAAHTSTAIIALLIGIGFYLWWGRGAALAIIPGAFYFFFIDGHTLADINRFSYWTDAVNKIGNHWHTILFGVGPGIYWQPGNMLHSEIAYLLWNLGVFGLILVALYIFRSFRNITDRRLFASFLIILIDGAGNHLMHTAATAMLATVIFALNDRQLLEV